jgi:hypothetical protein
VQYMNAITKPYTIDVKRPNMIAPRKAPYHGTGPPMPTLCATAKEEPSSTFPIALWVLAAQLPVLLSVGFTRVTSPECKCTDQLWDPDGQSQLASRLGLQHKESPLPLLLLPRGQLCRVRIFSATVSISRKFVSICSGLCYLYDYAASRQLISVRHSRARMQTYQSL